MRDKSTKSTPKKKKGAKTKSARRHKQARDTGNPAKPKWHAVFLELLTGSCSVTVAARGAGIDRTTAYLHYRNNKEFARQWDDAKEAAVEILEAEAWNRARKKSDTLMIFLLKAHKPEKYRERYELAYMDLDRYDLTDYELQRIAKGEPPASVLADRSKNVAGS